MAQDPIASKVSRKHQIAKFAMVDMDNYRDMDPIDQLLAERTYSIASAEGELASALRSTIRYAQGLLDRLEFAEQNGTAANFGIHALADAARQAGEGSARVEQMWNELRELMKLRGEMRQREDDLYGPDRRDVSERPAGSGPGPRPVG